MSPVARESLEGANTSMPTPVRQPGKIDIDPVAELTEPPECF
jgi:hypothetical protein